MVTTSLPCGGLSPHTRGSRPGRFAPVPSPGSIPAHAGEPRRRCSAAAPRGVYPRTRGGAMPYPAEADGHRGLSPHTRGSRPGRFAPVPSPGSIPAHAGEPRRRCSAAAPRGVYPRTRGGATSALSRAGALKGLSPHTRGSRERLDAVGHPRGSIPAHAGEPATHASQYAAPRVYPRTRGGARGCALCHGALSGLSPHTRGSPARRADRSLRRGSIPAHAGEPPRSRGAGGQTRVYPRTRGGAEIEGTHREVDWGLSPHTRGSPTGTRGVPSSWGSIPAHAGEPHVHGEGRPEARVYPRTRGGAVERLDVTTPPQGLSPHTRGSHRHGRAAPRSAWSIPAHAGEPVIEIEGPGGPGGLSPHTRGSRGDEAGVAEFRGSIPAHAGEP